MFQISSLESQLNSARKDVSEDGCHGLSCLKSAGRLSRHSNLNALLKLSLYSIKISFETATHPQDRSEATRRFDAHPTDCS